MSDVDDFFKDAARDEGGPFRIKGRPMLIPKGAPASARAPYDRASGVADKVMNMIGIHKWEMRYLVRAMSADANQDLRELAASEVYTTGFEAPDIDTNRASGARLDSIIYRALDRQGIHHKADRGTSIHGFCEDEGRLWEVPEHLKPYVVGYWAALKEYGFVVIAVERFIANDEVMAAGTFDVLLWHPILGYVVGDIKTGKIKVGFAVQKAIYANGDLYDTDTDERAPLESLTGGEQVNRSVGIILDVKEDGTKIYQVDLDKAWEITKAIKVVNDQLTMDLITDWAPPSVQSMIAAASSVDELRRIWETTKDRWTDEDKAALRKRKAGLENV